MAPPFSSGERSTSVRSDGRVQLASTGRLCRRFSTGFPGVCGTVGASRWAGGMSEIATPPMPRVRAAIAAARSALAEVSDAPVWSMDAGQVTEALDELAALDAQSAALRSRLIVQAESVEASESMSTPNWLARRQRLTRPEAHRQCRLAKGLDAHPITAAALTDARINDEQALAIIGGVDCLPDDLDPDLRQQAEEHLIELAKDHDAKALKNLGRAILEVVAPDLADAHLAKLLEKEERDAEEANRFRIWDTPQGRVRGDFDLDGLSGACLKKALFALAAPKHRASKGPLGERMPTAGAARAGVRRVRPPLPDEQAPEGRRPQRHRGRPDVLRDADGRDQGRQARHRRAHLRRPGPADRLRGRDHPRRPRRQVRGPRPRQIANASTPEPNASRPPSSKAAASRRAATHHRPSPRCTTPRSSPRAATPTATAGCSAPQPTDASTTRGTPTNASPTARSASTGGREPTRTVRSERTCPTWRAVPDKLGCAGSLRARLHLVHGDDQQIVLGDIADVEPAAAHADLSAYCGDGPVLEDHVGGLPGRPEREDSDAVIDQETALAKFKRSCDLGARPRVGLVVQGDDRVVAGVISLV